jgi:hypothetical protein
VSENTTKTKSVKEDVAAAMPSVARRPVLVIKYCRGRLGGSALLLAIAQRAKWSGREVLLIDGDESSKTLRTYYPSGPNAALVPDGTDAVAFKDLILKHMSLMVADRISRVIDLSGGSKDMDDVMAELNLSEFCDDNDIDLIVIGMLGPDTEDFEHVVKAVEGDHLSPKHMLMVTNFGTLRGGNPDAAFKPIFNDPRFKDLRARGAKSIIMPRLPVMSSMREAKADVYEVAGGKRPDGSIHDPVWAHMSKRWLKDMEQQFVNAGIAEMLP